MSFIVGKWLKKTEAPKQTSVSLESMVLAAKEDVLLRNDLILQYQPFVAKVSSKVCKKYIDTHRDEFSVALEAFNEAIDCYQEGQGSAFLTFAEMVIRRRVIDYIRRETRQTRDIFLEPDTPDEENQIESFAQVSASIAQYELYQESEKRKEDIMLYSQALREYGISFSDLVDQCPKHLDARENAKQIAKCLAETPELRAHLIEKKQLPMKDLLNFVNCSRKTVERNRKYIIAMSLIYIGDYQSLRSYIEPDKDIKERGV